MSRKKEISLLQKFCPLFSPKIRIVIFAMLLVARFMYGKFREYQMKKKAAKIEGLKLLYRQAMHNSEPSAPATVTIQQTPNRVTPYEPIRREMENSKLN